MQTTVLSPLSVFNLPQRLLVPLFQRPYVWDEREQWEPLWRDIERVADRVARGVKDVQPHFIGAVVLQSVPMQPGSMTESIVIDGQQRLTTLQLLMDAIHAEAVLAGAVQAAGRLEMLIQNAEVYCRHPEDRFKVWPTNRDREAFNEVMGAPPPIDHAALQHAGSQLVKAHAFFGQRAREYMYRDGEEACHVRAGHLEQTVRELLQMVVIQLDASENAQEIFETLNARGTLLSVADLIKNAVFQRLLDQGANVQQAYETYWRPLETEFWEALVPLGRLHYTRMSVFLWHWLIARTGEEIVEREIFTRFKTYADHDAGIDMMELLRQIKAAADVYATFVQAAESKLPAATRREMTCYRSAVFEGDSVRTLLLWLLDPGMPHGGRIPADVLERCFAVLETWTVRRAIIRASTKATIKTMVELIQRLNASPGVEADRVMSEYLTTRQSERNYMPDDDEVRRELTSTPTYLRMQRGRLRVILEAIEDHLNGHRSGHHALSANKITPHVLTIEHLMPQTWQTSWPPPPDDDEQARFRRIHQLGNLVLVTQALNSTVSNGPWQGDRGKRSWLQRHAFMASTADILQADREAWTDEDIDRRTQRLIDVILEIWPTPPGYRSQVAGERSTTQVYVELRDLIRAGLLTPGMTLYSTVAKYADVRATLTATGQIEVDGKLHDTPSGAGQALRGRATNGWSFWCIDPEHRKTLRILRELYRQRQGASTFLPEDIDAALEEVGTKRPPGEGSMNALWLAYWQSFVDYLDEHEIDIPVQSPKPQPWITSALGRSSIYLAANVTSYAWETESHAPEIRVEVVIERHEDWFNELHAQRAVIEQEYGTPLTWKHDAGVHTTRIVHRTPLDPTERSNWPACHEWMATHLVRLRTVMKDRVMGLG